MGLRFVDVWAIVIIFSSLGLIGGVMFFYVCLGIMKLKKVRMASRNDDASA